MARFTQPILMVSICINAFVVAFMARSWFQRRIDQHLPRVTPLPLSPALADLHDDLTVLCWILTMPKTHATKASAVKETWAPRCNKAVFMSSTVDPSLPSVALNVTEGRDNLWEKSRKAWYYVFQHYADDYDWFLKADDDTFVIVENLRYFCSQFDPNTGYYFGAVFKPFMGYASGGGGYVVSRAGLKKVGPLLAKDERCGDGVWAAEDVKFGRCMEQAGVRIGDSRDGEAGRFHPLSPFDHVIPGKMYDWYRDFVKYNTTRGPKCCSDLTISFHYVLPDLMREMNFYVYHLHPYGFWKEDDQRPSPLFLRRSAKWKTGQLRK